MTNKEACEPCAKRKVRCDKQEPCSNCKRRKKDNCVYPSTSPADRIKRLEALVRKFGGDPDNFSAQDVGLRRGTSPSTATTRLEIEQSAQPEAKRLQVGSHDPIVLEEDGQSFYLESRAWQGWLGNNESGGSIRISTTSRHPFLIRKRPDALSSFLGSRDSFDLATCHPSSLTANTLWDMFSQRVEPMLRISFRWVLKELRSKSVDTDRQNMLTSAETALVFATYYISLVSMTDEECNNTLLQPRSSLLMQYQALCEEALIRTNLLCMSSIIVIKAVAIYMMASYDRLSIQSLWSLMGIVARNAEKLGLHRDGTVLGLSPMETEERRRVWWQLQHIDLFLGIWGGLTPMTLMADWDAKLPSNIEDEDINPTTKEAPKERKGLTSMSYCLYTYWVLDKQRQIFNAKQGRFTLSWQWNTDMSPKLKDSVMSQLEDGLNQNFLQYCDPLQPLHMLLQLLVRYFVVGMQMRTLNAEAFSADKQSVDEDKRTAITNASAQNLKYYVAIQSQPQLTPYRWATKGMFSWHAFMFVLVEASREDDVCKARETWDLLASVYAANTDLFELSDDRRRIHAAEIVVAAWKAWQSKFGQGQRLEQPQFVSDLGSALAGHRAKVNAESISAMLQRHDEYHGVAPITPESFMTDENVDTAFDLDFQDIDWTFWNQIQ